MQLRDYQELAVNNTLEALSYGAHPVVSCATGGGKSLMIAELCRRLPGARILIATHRKELLQQNGEKLLAIGPDMDIGFYSAGLNAFDTNARIILGGVQSIYTKMERLQASKPFTHIIVDECHLVSPADSEAKLYNKVFAACSTAQRIGLSATPFRLTEGVIYGPPPCWFDVLAIDIGIRQLTPQWLAPLRGVLTAHDVPTTDARTRHGDFVASDLSKLACDETLVEGACDEICFLAAKRKKWIIFGIDIAHVSTITEKLQQRSIDARMATGATPSDERARLLDEFRKGHFRALVNCNLYTTGMDVPDIDAIILLRPTQSKGLLIQQLGRATRKAEGKKDAIVIDLAGNLSRHLPLDAIHDYHKSPALQEKEEKEAQQKQQRQLAHATEASRLDPMAEDAPALTLPVDAVYYSVVPSKHPAQQGKSNLKVLYRLRSLVQKWAQQIVCLEYSGGARFHASRWFERRKQPMPPTAEEAYCQARAGQYAMPEAVVLRQEGKYLRVIIEQFTSEGG